MRSIFGLLSLLVMRWKLIWSKSLSTKLISLGCSLSQNVCAIIHRLNKEKMNKYYEILGNTNNDAFNIKINLTNNCGNVSLDNTVNNLNKYNENRRIQCTCRDRRLFKMKDNRCREINVSCNSGNCL